MPTITIYSTKNCPYCKMTKSFLDRHKIVYKNIDVGTNQAAAEEMVQLSGQYGVPVIKVDDEIIIGFDQNRLQNLITKEKRETAYDVLIAGAGPAGLTAAVYCARKKLKTLIVSENIGGQALASWAIENYMGFRMVTGEDLMHRFEEQVREEGIDFELDLVTRITKATENYKVFTASGQEYSTKSLILAQGKKPRNIGVDREEEYIGRGLSICATCDGPLFANKIVAVVGGGNSALQSAIEMSGIASQVYLIVRSHIRADAVYIDLLKTKTNITTYLNYEVTALAGSPMLEEATIRERSTKDTLVLPLDGMFAEIGWVPNTSFVEGLVDLNEEKEIIIDINCHTSAPGIFAAGDVTNIIGKQIIIAAGEGAKAALEVYTYLMTH